MKKLAMIIEANNRAFACTRVAWFLKKIREMGEEINLYIFRSAGAWTLDRNYNIGEYNIYQLPDFTEFDGCEQYSPAGAVWLRRCVVGISDQCGQTVGEAGPFSG